jgi:LysR family transcriptional activator of nhaA
MNCMDVQQLNFHHLRYFWAVAKDGHLTRTAARLHVSQSALSAQIRELEQQLGETLFLRQGRKLQLSESGKIALAYAEDIFAHANELVATLSSGRRAEHVLRLGAVATLSRNFQESFVRPLLDEQHVRLQLVSGRFDELLAQLQGHGLDLVLANRAPRRQQGQAWHCRRIARQMVSVVGRARRRRFRFPEDLHGVRMIVPGPDSEIRVEFDALCERAGVTPDVVSEVDDMAMMRLLSRDTDVLSLLPSVVVRDELKRRELFEQCVVPGLYETFYAISVERRFQHPLLRMLLARKEKELLATQK